MKKFPAKSLTATSMASYQRLAQIQYLAGLWVHRWYTGKMSKFEVEKALKAQPAGDHGELREWLDRYKPMIKRKWKHGRRQNTTTA